MCCNVCIVSVLEYHEILLLWGWETNLYISTNRETTPLIGNEGQRICARMQSKFHCRRQRCCLTSKASILILLWNLFLVAGLESFLDPNYFNPITTDDPSDIILISGTIYSGLAFFFLFYPLAGCLADICWGRYKAVVNSLRIIWGSLVAMIVFGGVATLSFIPMIILQI